VRSLVFRRVALTALVTVVQICVFDVATPAHAALDVAQLQGDIVYLSNKQRELHGCPAMHVDGRLTEASLAHSAYMAQTRVFSHVDGRGWDFVRRDEAANYPAPLAENIAFGYRTGVEVVMAWMDSPAHRANLLNCQAINVGVGVALGADGTPYVTQDFGG
jgi:uncharacterized protein YkwD